MDECKKQSEIILRVNLLCCFYLFLTVDIRTMIPVIHYSFRTVNSSVCTELIVKGSHRKWLQGRDTFHGK